MFDIGRVCIKIAGRDAGQKCVIIEVLDNNYVIVDGMTRRRKCNKIHLEPLNQKLDIKNKATHDDVAKAFKSLDLEVRVSKPKPKTEKPKAASRAKAKSDIPKKVKKSKAVKEKSVAEKTKKE